MRTIAIVLATGAALAVAACSSGSSSPEDLCPSPTDTTSVEMADFSYTPACTAADAGASLELRNVGETPHTYTVSETEIDENVEAGASATIDLAGIPAGTYEVTCTLHPQMTGALQVR
jgi:plastocyanin